MNLVLLLANVICISMLLSIARKSNPVFGVIIATQAVFWLLSFVVRPGYLIAFKPDVPALLGDVRLAQTDYGIGMNLVLWMSLAQLATYLIIVLIGQRYVRKPDFEYGFGSDFLLSQNAFRALLFLYGLGWTGRFGDLAGISALATALQPFGVVAGAVLLISSRLQSHRVLPSGNLILIVLELSWAFLNGSKASAFIPIVALLMRWRLMPNRPTFKAWQVLIPAASALIMFFALQAQRGITNDQVNYVRSAGGGEQIRSAFISLVERFDGLSALVDAYWSGLISGWISFPEYLARLIFNLVPKGPFFPVDQSIGQQWTREVASQSVFNQYQDVSLAAGPGAEGFAIFGWLGLILFTALMASLTIVASNLFSNALLLKKLLVSFLIFSPVLYEQGLLGFASGINKGFQIMAVYWFINLLFSKSDSGAGLGSPHGLKNA